VGEPAEDRYDGDAGKDAARALEVRSFLYVFLYTLRRGADERK
jgi:hypothetical protein